VLAIIIESVAKVGPSFTPPDHVNPTGWSLNVPAIPAADKVLTTPDLGLLGKFNVLGSWQTAGWLVALMFAFTLLLTDFFDTMGTMVAVGQEGGLLNENGEPPRTREILLVASYIESAAGVGEGARTGAANLVTGALFLVAMFVSPFVAVVPFEAASAALVVVGFLMLTSIRTIDWTDYELAIPAFLTIVLMPFTYSISNGIGAGLISYVLLKAVRGKAREIHPLLWAVAGLFLLYFLRGELERLLF
jgi:AGZA family xanthine/uracil permease-like MFS transporter